MNLVLSQTYFFWVEFRNNLCYSGRKNSKRVQVCSKILKKGLKPKTNMYLATAILLFQNKTIIPE